MPKLVFKYSKSMIVLIIAGVPVLFFLSISLVCASYVLLHKQNLSVAMGVDAIFVDIVSVLFGWLLITAVRSWHSLFEVYSIDRIGLQVIKKSGDVILKWCDLRGLRYRRAIGQIELQFEGYWRIIYLNNVDMDLDRRSLTIALKMIEELTDVETKRSLL